MFSISTSGMRRLGSYNDCDTFFRNTDKPKRSARHPWEDNERPLDSPRMHHKRLITHNSGHSYSCVLYDTLMVEYFRNGEVTVTLHDSRSSRKFLDCVLPTGMSTVAFRGDTMLRVETNAEPLYLKGHTLILAPTGPGQWKVISGAHPRVREFVDRRKINRVLKELKPFENYYRAAERLAPMDKPRASHFPNYTQAMLMSPDSWPELAGNISGLESLRRHLYGVHDAWRIENIPNTLPPKRGSLSSYS